MEQEMVFTEKQKFSQWWLWVLLFGINGIFLYGLIKQLILGEQFGNNPLSNAGLVVMVLACFAFTFLFYIMGLYTKIDKHGIYFKFIPFHRAFTFYPWEKISAIRICKYKAFKEFGGWGIRGGRNGMAYTASGDTGIEMVIDNNIKILIGTHKPEEVKNILKELSHSSYHSA